MAKNELFVTEPEDLFAAYLRAFPEGTNPVLRKRTEHDCNTCKQFIRKLGVLVAFRPDGTLRTVWDDLDVPTPYDAVATQLGDLVRKAGIKTVFRTKERSYGKDHNFDSTTNQRWDHLNGTVEDRHYAADPATKRGEIEAAYQVFSRGVKELRLEDLDTVLDLIDNNGLYRGGEHRAAVVGFRQLLQKYDGTDNFIWANIDNRNARFRNTVIGTLLVDLASGMPIEDAVRTFETKVAPQNYKRPTSVITTKMVDEAIAKLKELGLEGAVTRRFARISDVSVNNVLFVDRSVQGKMKDAGSLKELLAPAVQKTLDPQKATPISIDNFTRDILPTATSMALFLQNRHLGNFVSLTGGDGPERLFKWDNNFAWSYDGEVTDSVKQRVKAAGGNVNALMRVSLSWSNYDDLDLHCHTPEGDHISYANKAGILDVDMNAGGRRDSRSPVENLAFTRLTDGKYKISVNNYLKVESVDTGFSVEVEFGGVIHQFSHGAVRDKQTIGVLEIIVRNKQVVEIKPGPGVTGGSTPTEKWGVKTENLVPVSILLNSPNHWDGQGVGAKHWFFMLKDCKNPDPARGIYNEFLRSDFEKHRKVFEILGAKTKCQPVDDQISGVGFTAARNDSVTVVVNGSRAYNITF
jgi:hypothetical protein